MDTSDPEIVFDETGQCSHCRSYRQVVSKIPRFRPGADRALADLVTGIKARAKNRKYDCLIGVSGGVDSTYLAYYVTKVLNLRPLAIHLDNGWNSEIAVQNIERVLTKLDIDLYTEVLDWREFSDLQLAFLKSSTPDCEIPTDHAIFSALYQKAVDEGISTIFLGINLVTEFILPRLWSQGHRDWIYIKGLNRKFGRGRLRTYPHTSVWKYFYLFKVRRLKVIRLFDYIDFNKRDVEQFIKQEFGWKPYPAKHFESLYTKFYQGYLLPRKFGFDKRRAHLSSLICAGQMTRDEAIRELQKPALPPEEEGVILDYVSKKLRLSRSDLDQICKEPPKAYRDYPSSETDPVVKASTALYRLVVGSSRLRDGISQ